MTRPSFTVELPLAEEVRPATAPASAPTQASPAKARSEQAARSEQQARHDGPETPAVYTVSALTREIRELLEGGLGVVAVEGEISNLKQAASGHVYFNLKDAAAQIRCVMFRTAAQGLRFQLEDGLQVLVRGRISVYDLRGEYQIQVLTVQPQGLGALQLAFEQLKAKLQAEGLFDAERKRPLPFLPRRVGVVTSLKGAALRDILTVLGRRFPGLPVLIAPATVQGDQAPGEIVAALGVLNRVAAAQQVDVIILGRGGGAAEDLWAFNDEAVARAIAASKVPVISAVGHEVDFTIADFVADVRAPTPSAAAELAVPNRADLLATVAGLRGALEQRWEQVLALAQERWSGLRARLGSPQAQVDQLAQRVDDLHERLLLARQGGQERLRERVQGLRERLLLLRPDRVTPLSRAAVRQLQRQLRPGLLACLSRQRARLEHQAHLLQSLSPLTVLGRGYALAADAQGRPVGSVAKVKPGDALAVRLQDGTLDTQVQAVRPAQP